MTTMTYEAPATATSGATATATATAPTAPEAATATATATAPASAAACPAEYTAVPVWVFGFEGVLSASYDVMKTSSYGWVVVAVFVAVNIVLARTVMRGRLKMARAMLKSRRTRGLAVGLIALRFGVHLVLGTIGVQATSGAAHAAFAVLMGATTVGLLAFDQRVMLRALNAEAAAAR